MPLGFERLNERAKHPNPHINFIKPLPGVSEVASQSFLERIAAQCCPVMKANHIYVMSLEEYAPNPEFAGRNFNAGEVIQLVLKSRNGAWLPFKHVQMVMMHELAHCKQMNHSGAFWQVRNAYAAQMHELWTQGYTGEGLWGRGRELESGEHMNGRMPDESALPANLCGGVYRSSRRRKRKTTEKPKISYAERKQKRILKKFGAGGMALGMDEDQRVKLEPGKKAKPTPRVAGSMRGRELRAAAALARFEIKPKEETLERDTENGSETEADYDWPESGEDIEEGVGRQQIKDSQGHSLVKVCEGDDGDGEDAKREMRELMETDQKAPQSAQSRPPKIQREQSEEPAFVERRESKAGARVSKPPVKVETGLDDTKFPKTSTTVENDAAQSKDPKRHTQTRPSKPGQPVKSITRDAAEDGSSGKPCSACSFENDKDAVSCVVCANVIDLRKMSNHWKCESRSCREGTYVNLGDYGRCQICGALKPDAGRA